LIFEEVTKEIGSLIDIPSTNTKMQRSSMQKSCRNNTYIYSHSNILHMLYHSPVQPLHNQQIAYASIRTLSAPVKSRVTCSWLSSVGFLFTPKSTALLCSVRYRSLCLIEHLVPQFATLRDAVSDYSDELEIRQKLVYEAEGLTPTSLI